MLVLTIEWSYYVHGTNAIMCSGLLNTTAVTKDAKVRLTKQDLLRIYVNYRGPLNNPVTPVGSATRSFWTTGLGIGSDSFVNRLAPGNAYMWQDTKTRRSVDLTLTNKINTNILQGDPFQIFFSYKTLKSEILTRVPKYSQDGWCGFWDHSFVLHFYCSIKHSSLYLPAI